MSGRAVGDVLRFVHEPDGPDRIVSAIGRWPDGAFVELEDMAGQFAASIFLPLQ